MSADEDDAERSPEPDVVRASTGANCSSVGSVIDMLFATAAVSTAVFAAAWAALERESPGRRAEGNGDTRKAEPDDAPPG